jgi:hypothetical protein
VKDKNVKEIALTEGTNERGSYMKKVKVNMVGVLSVQYEYKTFKPVEITIRRELR